LYSGYTEIENVRVEKCGQNGVDGKYFLHFHRLRSCPKCVSSNNANDSGQQRGMVLHGTHLSNVVSNMLYDVRGAQIYVEGGNEMYTVLAYTNGYMSDMSRCNEFTDLVMTCCN